jgi:hypothetical protein
LQTKSGGEQCFNRQVHGWNRDQVSTDPIGPYSSPHMKSSSTRNGIEPIFSTAAKAFVILFSSLWVAASVQYYIANPLDQGAPSGR